MRLRRRPIHTLVLLIGVAIAGTTACATAPPSDPLSATVWGYVRLVPKENAALSGGGYGDRRLASVKRFDYSHPRYAVVFAPNAAPADLAPLRMNLQAGPDGAHLEPVLAFAATTQGVSIRNDTGLDQIVSAPGAGWVSRIAAGETTLLEGLDEGELILHVLGGAGSNAPQTATLWIASGRIVQADESGRYVIDALEPGQHELRAWHPRLPPTRSVGFELGRGDVRRLDLEIGVDPADLRRGDAQ